MAIRLYPQTNDAAILERLAEVPAGTHDRLVNFERATPIIDECWVTIGDVRVAREQWDADLSSADEGYARYCASLTDVALATLGRLLLQGWGRMMAHWGDAGSTTDETEVRSILTAQGFNPNALPGKVTLKELAGLKWH